MTVVLVLGTRNQKKCQEIKEILGGMGLSLGMRLDEHGRPTSGAPPVE